MKKAFLIILLCPLVAYSQDKPKAGEKHYVNDEGKLYWHGKKPVYVFIADNPDGINLHRLESQNQKEYTNPLYFDTEGVNYIRTNWASDSSLHQIQPKMELLFEVYRDSKPPETSVMYIGAPSYKSATGEQFYGKGLKLQSNTYDRHSGVQKTFLSIDNGSFKNFEGIQVLNEDKIYDIKIYSADNTGNVEPIQMYQFRVDLTSPISEYVVRNDRSGMVFSPEAFIELKSVDATTGLNRIGYQIDNGSEKTFNKKIVLSDLEGGPHTIKYYGYDNVQNKEDDKLIEFYLDKTAPEVTFTIVGDQYQNRGRIFVSTRTKVKLTANDNKAGVKNIKYSIDGGDQKTYYEPFTLVKTKGNHIVTYYATDKVNNSLEGKLDESNLNRSSLNIDMKAPDINYKFAGKQYFSRDTSFITSKSEISLTAEDSESGVKDIGYKINGGQGQNFDSPIQLEKEGIYTIDFYGTDLVNNRNTKSFFSVVDNSGPIIKHILSIEPIAKKTQEKGSPLNVYPKGVKLFLGATDVMVDVDKIFYVLNTSPEIEYTEPIIINSKGVVTYTIRATDKLGNSSILKDVKIFIK